jgi:hypothetical protein
MTSLLNFHALAATRGEGLLPELRARLERSVAAPCAEFAVRNDGMIQSGPDPKSEELTRRNLSLVPQVSVRQKGDANRNPATPPCPQRTKKARRQIAPCA